MRKRFLAVLSLSVLAACQAQPSPAPSAGGAAPGMGARETTEQERTAVLASLQGFMDALKAKDVTAMNLYVDSLTRMTLIRPTRDGGSRVVVMTGAQFISAVTQPNQPPIDEPIRNPVVHVSGDLATVWAEYQVRRESTVSHCGFDAFHLARRDGRWKLLNISDTYQPDGCGPAWPR